VTAAQGRPAFLNVTLWIKSRFRGDDAAQARGDGCAATSLCDCGRRVMACVKKTKRT